jgi:quercetin dioxygenase-like cupin family protein
MAELTGAVLETIQFPGLELRFLRTKQSTEGSLDLFEMDVAPKAGVPIAHHHTGWDETVYGLRGAITFRVDGAEIAVGPGQNLFIKRGAIHSFMNFFDEPATCLSILTPGVLGPDYFREMAALIARGKPDPAQMKKIMLRYGLVPAPN